MSRRKKAAHTPKAIRSLDPLREDLMRDEGLRLRPYRDTTGHLTIGYGRNLDVGISEQEAQMLLTHDISDTLLGLNRALPWFATLDPIRQRVLGNMAFNLGVKGLLAFKQTLALVEGGDYRSAATAMLESLWAKQTGARAKRLAVLMRMGTLEQTKVVKV